jgi:hypothetical protein
LAKEAGFGEADLDGVKKLLNSHEEELSTQDLVQH